MSKMAIFMIINLIVINYFSIIICDNISDHLGVSHKIPNSTDQPQFTNFELQPTLKENSFKQLSSNSVRLFVEKALQFNYNHTKLKVDLTVEEKWIQNEKFISDLMSNGLKDSLPLILDLAYKIELSPKCANGLFRIIEGIRAKEEWAFSLLDSFGRLPAGSVGGMAADLGEYDQCREVRAKDRFDETQLFKGKYCLLSVSPPLPPQKNNLNYGEMVVDLSRTSLDGTFFHRLANHSFAYYSIKFKYGICIPSTCNPQEIQTLIKKLFDPFYFDLNVGPTCDVEEDSINLDFAQLTSIIIISVQIVLITSASLYLYCKSNIDSSKFINKAIECFSMTRNASILFDLSKRGDPKLQFIHGTRVMTMIWIIICHTYTLAIQFLPELSGRIYSVAIPFSEQLSTQLVMNGILAVETFFFMSGATVIYVALPYFEKKRDEINFVKFVLLRWIRFVPSLIGIILINFIWPKMGSGPLFKERSEALTNPCYSNWWMNILFINNWVGHHDAICLKHTWYLSADFQLHVLVFFLLQLYFWSDKLGLILNSFLIMLGVIIPAAVVYVKQLPPTLIMNKAYHENFERSFSTFYFPTYNHMTPYFLGVIVGYSLIKNKNLDINRITEIILWIILPISALSVVLSTYLWNGLRLNPTLLVSTTYAGLNRLVWSIFLAWIALRVSFKQADVINRILSAKIWIPFSRLSYQIYLIHLIILYYHILTRRSHENFRHYDKLFSSCGIFIFSILAAFFCHLLFEAPFAHLMKLVLTKNDKNPNQTNHKSDQVDCELSKEIKPPTDIIIYNIMEIKNVKPTGLNKTTAQLIHSMTEIESTKSL